MENGIPWNGMELLRNCMKLIIFPYGNSILIIGSSISVSIYIPLHFQNQITIPLFVIISLFHFHSISIPLYLILLPRRGSIFFHSISIPSFHFVSISFGEHFLYHFHSIFILFYINLVSKKKFHSVYILLPFHFSSKWSGMNDSVADLWYKANQRTFNFKLLLPLLCFPLPEISLGIQIHFLWFLVNSIANFLFPSSFHYHSIFIYIFIFFAITFHSFLVHIPLNCSSTWFVVFFFHSIRIPFYIVSFSRKFSNQFPF